MRIDYYNSGDSNETNINVTLEIEQALYSNKTINIESNQTYEWQVYWKPNGLGDFNITSAFDGFLTACDLSLNK